jgi:hypothetical protein
MEQSYTQLQIPSRPPAEGDGEIRSAWDCLNFCRSWRI